MKKITLPLVAAIVIILFFFTSCDKYHRDRYTGTWDFVTEMVYYNEGETPSEYLVIKRDTIYYTGKISMGNYENQLIIKYSESDEVFTGIDKDGYLYHKTNMFGKYACGNFESKNTMDLTLCWGEYVAFEGDTDYRSDYIIGTKKGRR